MVMSWADSEVARILAWGVRGEFCERVLLGELGCGKMQSMMCVIRQHPFLMQPGVAVHATTILAPQTTKALTR